MNKRKQLLLTVCPDCGDSTFRHVKNDGHRYTLICTRCFLRIER